MERRTARQYDPAELEHFASYRQERAAFRPRRCKGGERCWVTYGPPVINSSGVCTGCRSKPMAYRLPVEERIEP